MMKVFLIVLLLCCSATFPLLACDVPVFRYALERWERDDFLVVLTHEAKLSPEQELVLKQFQNDLLRKEESNLKFHFASDLQDKEMAKQLGQKNTEPTLYLFLPSSNSESARSKEPIWSGTFNSKSLEEIQNSPLRSKVNESLLRGTSAVIVLLKSADETKNIKAKETILEAIRKAEKNIVLPGTIVTVDDQLKDITSDDPENELNSDIPLQIKFELIETTRSQDEEIFVSTLMNIENDLEEYKTEPMVFTTFGRGRFLEPILGKGINERNLLEMLNYICGACSCRIKADNPGMDFISQVNWEKMMLGSSTIKEKELPPISGVGDLIKSSEELKGKSTMVKNKTIVEEKSTPIWIYTLLPLTTILLFLGIIYFRKPKF